MKQCRYCAEDIQDAAIVCKHCGRDLETGAWHVQMVQPQWGGSVFVLGAGIAIVAVFAGAAAVWMLFGEASSPLHQGPATTTASADRTSARSPVPAALAASGDPAPAAKTAPMSALPIAPEPRLKAHVQRMVRGVSVVPQGKGWLVRWALPDSRTGETIKSGARLDMVKVLKAVTDSGVPYDSVRLEGMFDEIDRFGNSKPVVGVSATFAKATVERINWSREAALPANIYEIANRRTVHRAFR